MDEVVVIKAVGTRYYVGKAINSGGVLIAPSIYSPAVQEYGDLAVAREAGRRIAQRDGLAVHELNIPASDTTGDTI